MINKLILKKVVWYIGFISLALSISLAVYVVGNIEHPLNSSVRPIATKILVYLFLFLIVLLTFFLGHLLLLLFEWTNKEINKLEEVIKLEDEKEQDSL